MGGAMTRNFKMFRNLCGESALKNVVIVTNMWGGVEPEVGEAREAELMGEDIFFKSVLEKGAKMARHENTVPSAENIIRLILNNHPLPLQIQRELFDEHKDILDTSAGEELNRELNDQIKKHQEDMRALTEEMEQATKDKDEETRNELEIETKRMEEEVERFENEAKRLASNYQREKSEFQAHFEEMERARREVYPLTQHPRHSSRGWGHSDIRPPPPAYMSTLTSTPTSPTTEARLTNAPGQVGKESTSWDWRGMSSVAGSVGTHFRNLYDGW
jgi:hypothetical protein